MKKRTDRARVKELLRTGREVCSRFIVYKKIALAVGPSDASHFLVFFAPKYSLWLRTPFVVWVSERAYVNNRSNNKAS